jgi:hypothetical protein
MEIILKTFIVFSTVVAIPILSYIGQVGIALLLFLYLFWFLRIFKN